MMKTKKKKTKRKKRWKRRRRRRKKKKVLTLLLINNAVSVIGLIDHFWRRFDVVAIRNNLSLYKVV